MCWPYSDRAHEKRIRVVSCPLLEKLACAALDDHVLASRTVMGAAYRNLDQRRPELRLHSLPDGIACRAGSFKSTSLLFDTEQVAVSSVARAEAETL